MRTLRIRNKIINETNIWYILILLAIILFVGNYFIINTSRIVGIICLLSLLVSNENAIIALVSFIVPVSSGVTNYYIFGLATLLLLLKNRAKIQASIILPVLFFSVLEFIMTSISGGVAVLHLFSYICVFFLFFYIINSFELNAELASETFIFGSVLLLVTVFSSSLQKYGEAGMFSGLYRIGYYADSETIASLNKNVALISDNANNIAYYSIAALSFAFSMLNNSNRIKKILLIAAIVVNIFIGFFTISRTWLIILVILVFLVLRFNFKIKNKILLGIAAILIGYFIISYLTKNTSIIDVFEYRLNTEGLINNNRSQLFNMYWDFFWNNPTYYVFGTGALCYREVTALSQSIHNGTLQILLCYGIIGLVVFATFFFKACNNRFKLCKSYLNDNHIATFIPLITTLLFVQTIQFIYPQTLMLPVGIAVLFINYKKDANNDAV